MEQPAHPKVFISYSWTSDAHKQWVLGLATRLRNEGANVILDRWHLKEGQDKYKFMEQMVTDPDMTKVLMICDKKYKEKADSRTGGVGDEALIISPEIYGKAEQQKFIPLIRERDDDGKEYVPVFVAGRKYIDFCEDEYFEESYDALIRLIHGQPELTPPAIGQPPKHIYQNAVLLKTAGNFSRLKDAAEKSKPHVTVFLQEYFDTFIESMEDFRISHEARPSNDFDELVVKNIADFSPYRDNLIDVFFLVAKYINTEEAYDHVFDFLEKSLAYQFCPEAMHSYNEASFDNYRFTNYEMALYFIAIMVKSKRYPVIGRFFESNYRVMDDSRLKQNRPFATFNWTINSLNYYRNNRLGLQRFSVVADMIVERRHLKMTLPDLVQADFLAAFQSALATGPYGYWWPQLIVYGAQMGSLDLFGKVTSQQGLKALQGILGIGTLDEVHAKIEAFAASDLVKEYGRRHWIRGIPFHELLNVAGIERALGKQR
jgi:hypothetical protein